MWYSKGLKEIGEEVRKLQQAAYTIRTLAGETTVMGRLPKDKDIVWLDFICVHFLLLFTGFFTVPLYWLWQSIDKKYATQNETMRIINEHLPELELELA